MSNNQLITYYHSIYLMSMAIRQKFGFPIWPYNLATAYKGGVVGILMVAHESYKMINFLHRKHICFVEEQVWFGLMESILKDKRQEFKQWDGH